MKEIWIKISGFEGLYEASSFGNIRSVERFVNDNGGIKRLPSVLLKGEIVKGYKRVSLSKKSKKTRITVHRIVAVCFLNNIDCKKQVNHKDGNKLNNSVSNLEWCTAKENIKHAHVTGLMKVGKPNLGRYAELSHKSKPVMQLDKNLNFIKLFPCLMAVQRDLGFNRANIGACALGKIKTAYGYKWVYKK